MRIYLAGPWVRKDDVRAAGRVLTAAGHTLTSRWIDHHAGSATDATGKDSPLLDIIHQAREDIVDVLAADVLIVLNLERSEGKAVETGIALANGIPVISVGTRSNIFQTLGTEVATIEEALALLRPTYTTDSDPGDEN